MPRRHRGSKERAQDAATGHGTWTQVRRVSSAAFASAQGFFARTVPSTPLTPDNAKKLAEDGVRTVYRAGIDEARAVRREAIEARFARRQAEQIRFLPFHPKHDKLDALRAASAGSFKKKKDQASKDVAAQSSDERHLHETRGGIRGRVLPRLTYYERAANAFYQLLKDQQSAFSETASSATTHPLQQATKRFHGYVFACKKSMLSACDSPEGGRFWPNPERGAGLEWAIPARSEHSFITLVGHESAGAARTFTKADALPLLMLVHLFKQDFPNAPVAIEREQKPTRYFPADRMDVSEMVREAFRELLTECPHMLDEPHEHPGLQLVLRSLETLGCENLTDVRARDDLDESLPPSQALRTLSRISIFYAVFAPVLVRMSALSIARGGDAVFDLSALRATWLDAFRQSESFGSTACARELRSTEDATTAEGATTAPVRSEEWSLRLNRWMHACLEKKDAPDDRSGMTELDRLDVRRISRWSQLTKWDVSPFNVAHHLFEGVRTPYGGQDPAFVSAYRVLDALHQKGPTTTTYARQQTTLVRCLETLKEEVLDATEATDEEVNKAGANITLAIQQRRLAVRPKEVQPEGTNHRGYCNSRQVLEDVIARYQQTAASQSSKASEWLKLKRSLLSYRLRRLAPGQRGLDTWLTDDLVYGGEDSRWGELILTLNAKLRAEGLPQLPFEALKHRERDLAWQDTTFLPWMNAVVEAGYVEATAKKECAETLQNAFQAKHAAYQKYRQWSVNLQVLLGLTMVATFGFTTWWMLSLSPLAQVHGMHRALLALPGVTAYHVAFYLVPSVAKFDAALDRPSTCGMSSLVCTKPGRI